MVFGINKKRESVGVITGTFSPPDKADIKLIQQAARLCDTLYVMVEKTYENQQDIPFHEKSKLLSDILDNQHIHVVSGGHPLQKPHNKAVRKFFKDNFLDHLPDVKKVDMYFSQSPDRDFVATVLKSELIQLTKGHSHEPVSLSMLQGNFSEYSSHLPNAVKEKYSKHFSQNNAIENSIGK